MKEYRNKEMETMPDRDMKEIQMRLLKKQLTFAFQNSPLWKKKIEQGGIKFQDIDKITYEAFSNIPFTTKQEIRESQEKAPPFGEHLCAPARKIIRVQSSAGTTGKPVYQAFTRHDVANVNEMQARGFVACGIKPGDRIINMYALSMFSGGIPICASFEAYGLMNIPVGAEAGAERLLRLAKDLEARVLLGTPSYANYLAEKCPEILGIPAFKLGIEIIKVGGEPGGEDPAFRKKLEMAWGTEKIYDSGSMSDAYPNTFSNCYKRVGKHQLTPDFALIEFIDPDSGKRIEIEDGAEGEYLITHLDREACPLVRYRSGDRIKISTSPCECGRTGMRISYLGRTDDMLIVRGMNVYPQAVRSVICDFLPDTTGEMRIILDRPGHQVTPPVNIAVEYSEKLDREKKPILKEKLEEAIRSKLHFRSNIELVPPKSIERSVMKTKLVVIKNPIE